MFNPDMYTECIVQWYVQQHRQMIQIAPMSAQIPAIFELTLDTRVAVRHSLSVILLFFVVLSTHPSEYVSSIKEPIHRSLHICLTFWYSGLDQHSRKMPTLV